MPHAHDSDVTQDKSDKVLTKDEANESASKSESSTTKIDDSLATVGASFHWFNDKAQQSIESMRAELKEKDEPPWAIEILLNLLEVAVGAGAGAAGFALMERFKTLSGKGEVRHELVKGLFEEGIKLGVETGKGKLRSGNHDKVADSFIDSHKDAARDLAVADQKAFFHRGRHEVKTYEEAAALEELCGPEGMAAAGEAQAAATRDAWVAFLAQSKFGASHSNGKASTNMSPQDRRDDVNHAAPGFVPATAPNLGDSLYGRAPGVLEIVADLPEIGSTMDGAPSVALAMLDGVNANIRHAYENKALSEVHIPRQVVAHVKGDMPDFTVNLDENGTPTRVSHAQAAWLRARAALEHPELDDLSKKELGLKLLLEQLVPSSIRGGLGK